MAILKRPASVPATCVAPVKVGCIGPRLSWSSRKSCALCTARAHCFACICSTAALQSNSVLRHLTTPSSGRSKGRCAPFGPPLMSNVRSRLMRRHTRGAGQSPSGFSAVLERHERQQETVQVHAPSSASIANARRFLGHPSVGGRLIAGAARRSSQGSAVLHVRASVQVGCSVPAEGHIRSVGLRACRRQACAASISRANSRNEMPVFGSGCRAKAVRFHGLRLSSFQTCLPAPNLPVERTC